MIIFNNLSQGGEFIGNKKLFEKLDIYFTTKHSVNKANYAERYIYLLKRKLYLMMRGYLSDDWPKFVPFAVKALNSVHSKKLGGLSPGEINSFFDDVKVRQAQTENCVQVYKEPNYTEQETNQKVYESSSNPLQVGTYVYLDYKPTAFDKAFDRQVSYFLGHIRSNV
jgi:hypothetical protein